jgi:hypothetical protein
MWLLILLEGSAGRLCNTTSESQPFSMLSLKLHREVYLAPTYNFISAKDAHAQAASTKYYYVNLYPLMGYIGCTSEGKVRLGRSPLLWLPVLIVPSFLASHGNGMTEEEGANHRDCSGTKIV